MPRFDLDCTHCGAPIVRQGWEVKRNTTGWFFCDHKCRGAYRVGENAPHWAGGRYVSKTGYVWVYWPENAMATSTGYVAEHRLVASFYLMGRDLLPEEVVHHKDRNRSNNDPSNLEVTTRTEHARQHLREAWSSTDA